MMMNSGTYNVALNETHFKEILLQHTHPPPVSNRVEASLVMMGFPQQIAAVVPSLCVWYFLFIYYFVLCFSLF